METDEIIQPTISANHTRFSGETERTILHMDMDCFFVSVSRLINPKLNNMPVIVGGGDRGVVAACSYETRKFGVHSAMPIKQAIRLCPEAIIIRGDYDEYSKRSDEVTEIIREEVPSYERSSIDEFYMDMTGMDKFFGCYQHATELRQKIMKETGLPISFGMSANKTVSKVATDEAKPNNQMKIDFGFEKSFLAPLSVKKIPMVGEKTYALLRSMGVEKVHTLQQMPMELLQNVLGENGTSIWRKANGIDNSPVEPYSERKSISCEETFDADTIDVVKLKEILIKMAEKLAFQLRTENKLTACVSVKIRYTNFDTHTMQCRIPHTSNDHTLIARIKELFDKLFNRRMLIRLIGVRFSHLVGGAYQINLFEDSEEMINLYQAMDKMRILFGSNAIHRAVAMTSSLRSFNPFNGISFSPEKDGKLTENEFEYLLVIYPPKYISEEIMREKKQFAQQYNFPHAQKLSPQIILATFYLDESKEEELISKIDELCMNQPPFDIELNNYKLVPQHTVYMDVKNALSLIDFVKVLKKKLGLAPSTSAFCFHPHLTIAHKLTRELFLKAKVEYEEKIYSNSFIVQSITLLKRRDEFDTCLEIKEFEFYCIKTVESFVM